MKFDIIKRVYLWVIFGIFIMIGSIIIFISNIRLDIGFTGGIDMKIMNQINNYPNLSNDLNGYLLASGFQNISIITNQNPQYSQILLKLSLQEEKVNELSQLLKRFVLEKNIVKSNNDILEVSVIGPSIGDYMKKTAIRAITIGSIFMGIYILFAFFGMRIFIDPLILAVITTFTMLFDISVPAGAYGLLLYFNSNIQVDLIFIISLLTIMGYSVNDTIIIFDRIRENFINNESKIKQGKLTYREIFESSLWQTMRRSIGTSMCTFLVVLAMYIWGTGVLQGFAFTLCVGIITGSYSSIFLAAPLAYLYSGKYNAEKDK